MKPTPQILQAMCEMLSGNPLFLSARVVSHQASSSTSSSSLGAGLLVTLVFSFRAGAESRKLPLPPLRQSTAGLSLGETLEFLREIFFRRWPQALALRTCDYFLFILFSLLLLLVMWPVSYHSSVLYVLLFVPAYWTFQSGRLCIYRVA